MWLCMDRGRSNHSCIFYALCYIMDCFESLLSVLCDEGECNRNNNSLVKKSFNIIHNFSLFKIEVGLERDHHGIVISTHQNVHRCIGRTERYHHHCRRVVRQYLVVVATRRSKR